MQKFVKAFENQIQVTVYCDVMTKKRNNSYC